MLYALFLTHVLANIATLVIKINNVSLLFMPSTPTTFSKDLRQQLRHQRRQLTSATQQQHAQQALKNAQQLLASNAFNHPQNIALFISQDGELSSQNLIQYLWQNTSHRVYLPVLQQHSEQPMTFALYRPDSQLKNNRFHIPEPFNTSTISASQLDWVFTPLVAYDDSGNRMGMGGGFYDRTFAFKQHQHKNTKPHLIGWAHSLQKITTLPTQPWDIPLCGVINEIQLEWFYGREPLND
ncbi:5-formyltetrahydrofolate cyclo-ligase [Thiosulfatimonas sediminis]|uniref:5-formyltetrahydrofolate cyclo-ligase n=1 Tax=Thiosulfatimonas sediminis TaxID=2675054 RepID=A0A6F8PU52_9GAMM|nr:5-formyltetrahydrofolate cyclo-ligase [Thiosulfatimonas sediminis]BBP45672.1 5-formyltetrahydrofolate cyclo-ligase [Thiosulfatimonas sediminis]